MPSKLCMNCFSDYNPTRDGSRCPLCGWDNSRQQPPRALKYETELASRYITGRARSQNGEGITYRGLDISDRSPVCIREFYPAALARRSDSGVVEPAREHFRTFQQYKDNFLELAKSVSRLREVTVVESVLDIVEDNGTVYTIYKEEETIPLEHYVQEAGGRLSWNETSRLFNPVITAMSLINSLGVSHLALSPVTLRVNAGGNMLISGFGISAIHRSGGLLELELYPGCAAVEQYSAKAACGEVSDVYALGACMLFCLTGQLPAEAPKRLRDQRLMIQKEILKAVPPFAVTAIANSLQIKQAERTGSFETLRMELSSAPALVEEVEETDAIRRLPPVSRDLPRRRRLPPIVWLGASFAIALVVLIVAASSWMKEQGMSFNDLGHIFDSSYVEPIAVPNMLNQSYDHWERRVDSGELNFKLKVSSQEFDDTVGEGKIISQTPGGGETVRPGGTVSVIVSRGRAMRKLPEYEGESFAQLQGQLSQDGFTVAKQEQASDTVELGYVIGYKDMQPGQELEYATTVTVIVSTGPAEE